MRRFKPLFAGGLLLAAAGCSTLPTPETSPADSSPSPAPVPASIAPATPQPAPAQVPSDTPLDGGLLYELLVAEFAGQRGALQLSAASYLDAAERTRDPRVARRAVHVSVFGRDFARALAAAKLWVELAPDDIEARQSLATLLLRQGEAEAATRELESVVAAIGDSEQAFALITSLLTRERDTDIALRVMQRLVEPRAEDPHALYAIAHLANSRGHSEQALQSLDQLLSQEPEWVKALVLKSSVLHKLGEKEGAVASIRAAVDLSPNDTELRLNYARLLIDAQRLDQARAQFRHLEKALPDNPDIAYALGLLAMQAEELDVAERYFRKLLRVDARSNEAAYALGQIAEEREDRQQAMQWYQSVGQGDNFMDARLRIAQIIADRDGVEQARAYLAGLELGTPDQRLRRYLAEGALLRQMDRDADALEVYSDGLAIFIDNTELLYARAMAAESVDRIDLLEQDLIAILEKEPDHARALNALGYTLADRTDRFQEAKTYIERAFEQSPDDPAVIDSMGWVLYRMGEYQEAATHLRRALALQPDGEIAAHLGEVLWALGETEQARDVWNQALEYAPDDPRLQRVMERFVGGQ